MIHVVAGLIYQNGRLLICQRRAGGAFPLKWEFPGGKIEAGESDEAALRRELREELGIEPGCMALIERNDHRYPDGPQVSLSFYRVCDFSGEVKNAVFEQILWVELSELGRFDFLDGDRPIVERLLSDRGKILLQS